jgi:predicted small lipoprotein YifL
MRLFLLPTLVGLLLLAGCGQKGPLYIPKDDAPDVSTTAKTNATVSTHNLFN